MGIVGPHLAQSVAGIANAERVASKDPQRRETERADARDKRARQVEDQLDLDVTGVGASSASDDSLDSRQGGQERHPPPSQHDGAENLPDASSAPADTSGQHIDLEA